MKFKNQLNIKNLIEERFIKHYRGDGKSWATLSMIITPSKNVYEVEYYNKPKDEMGKEIFEDANKSKAFAKRFGV